MAKAIAEQSNALSIFWFKKYINDGLNNSGVVTWTSNRSENKSSIGFQVKISERGTSITFQYTHTDNFSGSKEELNYPIMLTTTPCNYGGNRYWFICPLSKNGINCSRRVGVLYAISKYFGCRHCGEIAYDSQRQTERYKGFVSIPDIEKAEKKVKRYFYNGKPTKKYQRLIKLNNRFERGLINTLVWLNK